jgi:hypothetical protein
MFLLDYTLKENEEVNGSKILIHLVAENLTLFPGIQTASQTYNIKQIANSFL